MKQALQIQFLGTDASPAVEAAVREKVAKLEQLGADVVSCRVTVELLNKHQQQGKPFAVRLDVRLPGHELAVNHVQDEDVYVALRDAFEGMRRQVEATLQKERDVRRGGAGHVPVDAQ